MDMQEPTISPSAVKGWRLLDVHLEGVAIIVVYITSVAVQYQTCFLAFTLGTKEYFPPGYRP